MEQGDTTDYAEACYQAITTLAFVAPDTVLPRVMEQLQVDLSHDINALTDLDIGVWNTPEGQTFIDGRFQPDCSPNDVAYFVCQSSPIKAASCRPRGKTPTLLNGTQKCGSRSPRRKARLYPHCPNRSRA